MEDGEQTQKKKEKLQQHPKARASFLSHLFFCWEIPVIIEGRKKELNEDDLYEPLQEYESKELGDKLEQLWLEEEHFREQPSLWRCLIRLLGVQYFIYGLLYLPVEVCLVIFQPHFMRKLLDYYSPGQRAITIDQAYIYAGGLALVSGLRILFHHFFMFGTAIVGMRARIACSSLIYRKTLTMKRNTIEKVTLGHLVNLLSNDVNRFDQLAPICHYIWIAIIQLIVAILYLDFQIGHVALGGIVIILLCLAIQVLSLLQISKCRLKVAEKTDYRIRLMNDIICGIEAIKMYTWEKPFAKLVEIARSLELKEIKIASHHRLFINSFKIYIAKFCVFLSILAAVLRDFPLTPQYIFSLICVYETLRFTTSTYLPMGAIFLSETVISVRRIQEFLLTDYHKPSSMAKSLKIKTKQIECFGKALHDYTKKSSGIILDGVFVKWDQSNNNYVLEDVHFRASPGDLIGVIGHAGSGKSTLLHVILKEIHIMKGKLEVTGKVSYASQDSWIFPTSIKQNIIFGEVFDSSRYNKVIRVCALERDLTLFPHGDQTLVGERGVMLSGGQKARINLARAIYKDADIYLLDDPLSAVDAHVARHIYEECITEFLDSKCVILVTHQVHYLQNAKIYQLQTGKVIASGNYEEIIGKLDFAEMSSEPTTTILTKHDAREEMKEHRSTGTANKTAYKGYCLAAGHWSLSVGVVVLFGFALLFTTLLNAFLTFWTNLEQSSSNFGFFTTENCLYIYIALMIVTVISSHFATFGFTSYSMRASKNLHGDMLRKIVYSPMNFFNNHPSGRLLNRFSKDIGCIDELLPLFWMNGITVVFTGASIFIVIIILNYWMIVPSVLQIAYIIFICVFFQPTNRNIKRTEGITRSFVFSHMATTVQGLTTIRAQNAQEKLIQEFDDHQNVHSSAFYLLASTFASFGFWADFMSVVYTVLVIFSFFLLDGGTNAGNVGFAITQSIHLLGQTQYGVRTFGELDSQMTSVERVVEYAQLDPELDEGTDPTPESWPSSGKISFESVSLKYNPDDPPVLKDTTFQVQPGEKIGIIGRTGAGKSSLISVLFRLFHFDGSITIDQINTKSISLNNLRSKISIIPQEPILFLGSLRKNIDPFDEYSDCQIWQVLEELELKQVVSSLPSGLESLVTERGSNFSVGQRQLLCLVRAMLRNNKIIVLDEATANVDLQTDELIQSMIRKKFKGCTVLTIAHRLNTIIDSDKILAMDGGRVVEFDHPYWLLQNTDGYLYGFVKKSGDKMMRDFLKIAKKTRHLIMEDGEQTQKKKEKLQQHPKARASFLSHLFFCWEIPVIMKGWKKELNEDDLYEPLQEYESKELGDKLEQLWLEEEHFREQPSLWRCLIRLLGVQYFIYGLFYLPVEVCIVVFQPHFMSKLLDYYSPGQTAITIDQAYIYAGGLALVSGLRILFYHFFMFGTAIVGMRARIACSSLIYRKTLTMKRNTIEKVTLGHLVNLLSNDVNRFDQLATVFHYIWIAMIQLIAGILYLDFQIGHVALGGMVIILLCLAIQVMSLVQISKCRLKVAEKTDYRIRLMNDIICGIEAIKMYTWEKPFAKLVETARSLELKEIKTASHHRLFINAFKIYIGKFCVFLSILVAVLTNFPLTSQYIFSLICVYESLRFTTIIFLPMGVIFLSETAISVKRIQEFLLTDYHRPSSLAKSLKTKTKEIDCFGRALHDYTKKPPGIILDGVFVKWDQSYNNYVLEDVHFRASPGDLIGVIGHAGSGKSTLLQVILKEIHIMKGKLEITGEVSYASQDSWIFPTSIKQNIIFGEVFDSSRYNKVIRVCALERDLTLFPHGDQTLVGERGVMLSGGQKARINLARAIYKDADIYLLDDPLSAVDPQVARHIYEECILEFLHSKCVILVTHQVHYLQKAKIYQLQTGRIVAAGSYEEVIGTVDLAEMPSEPTTTILTKHDAREEMKEHRSTGTANKTAYKGYCLAAGHWSLSVGVVVLFGFAILFTTLLNSFLTFWTNLEQSHSNFGFFTTENCLYIYIALMIVSVLSNHFATFCFTSYSMKASKNLHRAMLEKMVYGPMKFFNNHPSGRILNRFSKDIGCIDEFLPLFWINGITVALIGASIFIVIIILNYWMIVPSILEIAYIIFICVFFQPTNRNIKRTEGIARSLVFTHMATTVQGLVTIRAQNSQEKLIQEFDGHQDVHSSAYYLLTATFASFGFWADFMSVVYTVLVIFSFFLLEGGTNAGNVGFAITQSIHLLGIVQYGVRTFSELDSQMTSVERVVEYAQLDPELDEGTDPTPESWPSSGKISFESVSLKYNPDDPPVLKDTTFQVQPEEKIGIIGRTGAGKSSLISVLFRLFHFDGSITIDQVNTKSISLNNLRSKISIIPQEPILFLGSLRKNIDPFDEYSDGQIWQALEELELKPVVSSLPSGLESLVTERGSNFSVGQRQLLCLVRAMLRNNKIIVLDEATANVDLQTDELIQSMIRKKFKGCTVLTIAHRLNTIIDSDKILAMDGGRVVEFDHPYWLLQNTDGYLYGFVKKSGDKMMRDFLKIAKKTLDEKDEVSEI